MSINWVVFGAAERELYQPLPFTKRFKFRAESADIHVKSIARVPNIDLSKAPSAHFPYLLPTKFQQDVNGNRLMVSHANMQRPSNVAVMHHYNTKSFKEYVAKRMRGKSDTLKGADDLIKQAKSRHVVQATQFTEDGWEATKQFLPKYRAFDLIG